MTFKEISIDSRIEEKLRWSESCYRTKRSLLLGDEKITELLYKFKKAAGVSHKSMGEVGVLKECRECEEREGGSCCGAGLENKYSGVLLLINLLLEQKFPTHRQDPQGCFFLKKTGCSLLARHVICVNYLCKKITERINSKKIAILREKEGIELEILFLLNERIKEVLKNAEGRQVESHGL
ncbi:hypothetical protein OAC89_03350 [Deltaproteobacteria bacterium]|nr:hypothetical protein [Deltaproteobacteria bacterium]